MKCGRGPFEITGTNRVVTGTADRSVPARVSTMVYGAMISIADTLYRIAGAR